MGKKKSRFASKHVCITGGSEGIGLELACQFVQRGAHVTIISRSQAKLESAETQLQNLATSLSSNSKVIARAADVTDAVQINAAVVEAEATSGPIDCLVCNAGMSIPGLFLEQDVGVSERTMSVNYFGTLKSVKAVLPGMVARGAGDLVIIASAMAVTGFGGYSSYAPSKWALRGLADCLRNELLGTGVSVSIGYPPDTQTPGFDRENTTKSALTHALNTALGAEVYPAPAVASSLLAGLEKGRYHLPSPDLGQNCLIESMTGLSPSGLWLPLRCLLAPVLVLASHFTTRGMDKAAKPFAAGTRDPCAATPRVPGESAKDA